MRTGGREYVIRSEGSGLYSIREVDRSRLPEGAPPLSPRSAVEDPAPPAFVDDAGRVDIAVFYTPEARRDAGGTDQINVLNRGVGGRHERGVLAERRSAPAESGAGGGSLLHGGHGK